MVTSDVPHEQEILNNRYEVICELGRGTQGRTLLARDIQCDTRVAIKVLGFGRLDSIKMVELFERETRVLRGLSHAAIPAYLDAFHVVESDGQITRYYLVQEYIDGESLEAQVVAGRFFDEGTVRAMLIELLKILRYLHELVSPVVHRDIKPSNIIQRADNKRLVLIDFGAVQQNIVGATGSSTIVGTVGFMPVEQLMGRATAASDLYALGATAIYLLSHKHPADISQQNLHSAYRAHVNISPELANFLDRLIAPHAEDRFLSATEALTYLEEPGLWASLKSLDGETSTSLALGADAAGLVATDATEPGDVPGENKFLKRLEIIKSRPDYAQYHQKVFEAGKIEVARSPVALQQTRRNRCKVKVAVNNNKFSATFPREKAAIIGSMIMLFFFSSPIIIYVFLMIRRMIDVLFVSRPMGSVLTWSGFAEHVFKSLPMSHLVPLTGWSFSFVMLMVFYIACVTVPLFVVYINLRPLLFPARLTIDRGMLVYQDRMKKEYISFPVDGIQAMSVAHYDVPYTYVRSSRGESRVYELATAHVMEFEGKNGDLFVLNNYQIGLDEKYYLMGEIRAFLDRL